MINRAIVGFLVAAAIPAISLALFSPITEGDPVSALGLMPIFFFFSSVATAMLGLPTFLALKRFGFVRWWSAIASGVAIGAVVATLVSLPNAVTLSALLVMGAIGGVSAFLFWVIWRRPHAV